MVNSLEKSLCTGCYACFNICPKRCISMEEDKEGFVYPVIDENICIKCNMCERVCPSLNKNEITGKKDTPNIYAAWSLDEEVRFNSTSGGVFTELAKSIIKNGGYVVGAKYNEFHQVEHTIIHRIEDISLLRQSKYAQSVVGNVYIKIKELLDKQKVVMFCGTPCQVAGIQRFLKKSYDNLVLCDFVCLGINSPKVYRKYLLMLEKQYNSKIKKVWFKNKTYGWNRFSTKIEFENGKNYLKDRNSDLYMGGYIKHTLYVRPSCYECQYKYIPHDSDITLADFWGVGNFDKKLDNDQGTSLVMINSNKGDKLFNSIREYIFCMESTIEAALPNNKRILSSAEKVDSRKIFFDNIDKLQFDKLIYKCLRIEKRNHYMRRVKKFLKIER